MRIFKYIIISMLFVLPGMCTVQAESLWNDNSSMFADHRAHAVGDILTIIISENSSATRSGNASNSKSASGSAEAGVGIFKFIGQASLGTKDSFQAKGAINNTNTVTGRITVTVQEIKPNGNMVITGKQSIKQNGEEQVINISGVVRPEDISADNTIPSSYVADAQIHIDGNGPIAKKQRQGILTQIFNFLF
ncbi:MAG: flagellar basal body L-ring protein FlgH [Pelosinus sp.]|nr:flagellar basal body L-ring protein FlgH [Pelosinus sp.]